MDLKFVVTLAEEIITGNIPDTEKYGALLDIPDHDVFTLFSGADIIRNFYFGREIHLCTICNGKSGRCSEDCHFCSQSRFFETDAPVYPLMEKSELQQGGLYAFETPINRYSIVTTGKRLPQKELAAVAEAMAELDSNKIGKCASLGVLDAANFHVLKEAGISQYHHNLETSQSHFRKICTTHTYQDRVGTIIAAKKSGLSVCSGGVFGIGETDDQVLELAIALRELNVDSIPINFLVPIKGTPMEYIHNITPLRCLKIIALFRYVLPNKDIIICGGREANLGELHPLIFYAGANGIMTGNYLTTKGRTLEKDLETIAQLEMAVRKK
ncbi:MAG: biotin synthase BioB [Desulfobacteraceae bacterium]|nr:biotin synthase BioB [Desulfobacteraceae bacterium]